jgi:hypothetical protein
MINPLDQFRGHHVDLDGALLADPVVGLRGGLHLRRHDFHGFGDRQVGKVIRRQHPRRRRPELVRDLLPHPASAPVAPVQSFTFPAAKKLFLQPLDLRPLCRVLGFEERIFLDDLLGGRHSCIS